MKPWLFVLFFVAACASAEPAAQPSAPAQTSAAAAPADEDPNYADARSGASDADVRDARRAYRAACQQQQSDGYCECMTGGMAQALAPTELAAATAAFTGQSVAVSAETRARVEATRAEVDRGCAQFRR